MPKMDNNADNYSPAVFFTAETLYCKQCKQPAREISAKIHKPTKKLYCGCCVRRATH